MVAILFFQNEAKNIFSQDFVMMISCKYEISTYYAPRSKGPTKLLAESRGEHLVFQNDVKIFPGKILWF